MSVDVITMKLNIRIITAVQYQCAAVTENKTYHLFYLVGAPRDKIWQCRVCREGEGRQARLDGEDVNSNDDDAVCSDIKPGRVIR